MQQLAVAFKVAFLGRIKRVMTIRGEPSLASADYVVRYLGQYTHRAAITNQRILSIGAGKVAFMPKDDRR